jgi:hypothetical protein
MKKRNVVLVDYQSLDITFRKSAFWIAYEATIQVQVDRGWLYDTADVLTAPPAAVRTIAKTGRNWFWSDFIQKLKSCDFDGATKYVDTVVNQAKKAKLKVDRAFIKVRQINDAADAKLAQAQLIVAGVGLAAGATLVVLSGGGAVVGLAARAGLATTVPLIEFCAVNTLRQAGKAIATGVALQVVDNMTDMSDVQGVGIVGVSAQKTTEFVATGGAESGLNFIKNSILSWAGELKSSGGVQNLKWAAEHAKDAEEIAGNAQKVGKVGNVLGLLFCIPAMRSELDRFQQEMPR